MKTADAHIRNMLRETHQCVKSVILYLERINAITDRQIIDSEKIYLLFHAAMTELQDIYTQWEELYFTDVNVEITSKEQWNRLSHLIDIITLPVRNNGVKDSTYLLNNCIMHKSEFNRLDIRCLTRNEEALSILDYELKRLTSLE